MTTFLLALLLATGSPRLETRDSFEVEPVAQTPRQIKWPHRTIEIALSTSLQSPGEQIKPGSDVVGAVRRALARWSNVTNIAFVIKWSSQLSVSPLSGGDGVNLITVADTLENESFNADSTTGRTRVFFDPETGMIAEADISINPHPRSEEGANMQFSTDGTPGTYDLEATFTHEIGHLLGLDHSSVLASTMQAHQAFNGMFGLPAFTERTLSEDDRRRVCSLYGSKQRLGHIEGRVTEAAQGVLPTRLTVFAESVTTGRIVASDFTSTDGSYVLPNIGPGLYRIFAEPRSEEASLSGASLGQNGSRLNAAKKFSGFELASQVVVKNNEVTSVNYDLGSRELSSVNLNPRWLGLNGELSTLALPIQAGKRTKVFLGGEGVDQVPASGINVNSPYFSIDPESLSQEQMGTPFPVISFELTIAPNAPFGDYSVHLQSNSGEVASLPGAITIDPGAALSVANPVDDFRFFVSQQYSDIFGREPDRLTNDSFIAQLTQCGTRVDCVRAKRLDISAAMLSQNNVIDIVSILYNLYSVTLNRFPRLSEFDTARAQWFKSGNDADSRRLSLILSVVQQPEFKQKYPMSMNSQEFVDSLLLSMTQKTGIDLSMERKSLVELFDGTNLGRAAILNSLVKDTRIVESQYNQGFVLAAYFTFLRRDPDGDGFAAWVNSVKSKTVRDASVARFVICRFINSEEYQLRFGMDVTHNSTECN